MASRKGIRLSKALARIDALTLRRIASGRYPAKHKWLHDGGGLFLRVRPGGGGSWAYRFQIDRRVHMMGLGSLTQIAAPQARELAAQHRKSLVLGQHPLHDRREERRQRRADQRAGSATFRQVAEQVLAAFETSQRHPATIRSWRQVLEVYAYPTLGNMAVRDIERGDILQVLRPVWGTMRDTSRRLRLRIEHVIDEAITLKLTDRANPARYADLKRSLAAFVSERPRGNHKALAWRELPPLMKRLLANKSLSAYALRLTILAATRTGETLGARFPEFAHGLWTIPASRMKGEVGKRREHRVPISTGIADIIADLKPGAERSPLLFAGGATDKPLSNMAMLMLLKGMGIDATVHGMRASFRSWAADHGYPRELAEAALAHVVPGVEGSYQRSDLLEARRAMMEHWSNFCLGKPTKASSGRKGR